MTTAIREQTAKDTRGQIATTMKAAVIRNFGDPDVLQYEEIARPIPKPGHVLIKVLAAGVNRLDHYIRAGSIVPELPFPHILGADAVGEVVELGEGVTEVEIGERVFPAPGYSTNETEDSIRPLVTAPSFALPGLHIGGTYTQYMEVPARWVVKDDTGLSPEEAATLPVVLATSVRAVKEVGEVKAGDTVLIHAGASGSGSMLIQVAKALGAQVATTVRDDTKGAFAQSLGADLIINTRKEDFVEGVKAWTGGAGVDVAIDNLAGDVLAKTIDAVRPLGTLVAFGFAAGTQVTFDITKFYFAQKHLRGSMAADPENFAWGLEQVRAGRIKPTLDRALPLRQAADAHRLIANNQVKGNIVLLPWAD
ncbi:MAG: zinc-binding dehydrogenase [Nitrospinae bacterium]|nr:zinc-binding dehydrogenase [Nitrospinota bacterium]